ncbi:hypothetical protein [Rubellimicrobium roseum]|uniref:Calcium-binding protein n=1 Tax=Rubellimicrobium roseum TaxID=687525 RepID=A0A5C4NQC8_9RHOB|nr:hypothetical protein [Rubellimicrobium roseum]TNC74877.1 hypothetical protein FHG71_01725 [Rubellimicrobium roseum]
MFRIGSDGRLTGMADGAYNSGTAHALDGADNQGDGPAQADVRLGFGGSDTLTGNADDVCFSADGALT